MYKYRNNQLFRWTGSYGGSAIEVDIGSLVDVVLNTRRFPVLRYGIREPSERVKT